METTKTASMTMIAGVMEAEMSRPRGINNEKMVSKLTRQGLLNHESRGVITPNWPAITVLTFMARNTYDWIDGAPPRKIQELHLPCRCYELGWQAISDEYAMTLLTPEQLADDAEGHLRSREDTVRNNIKIYWRFLRERGLIKTIRESTLGRNSAILLLLGDAEENKAVEDWAMECFEYHGVRLPPPRANRRTGNHK